MKLYLPPLNKATGALAQLVEQRTENPCVPGSIPGGTTLKPRTFLVWGFLILGLYVFPISLPLGKYNLLNSSIKKARICDQGFYL